MKTAISINNNLFNIAEKTAKELGISRSKLFSEAIEEYIENHHIQDITAKLNETYLDNPSDLEDDLNKAQFSSVDFGEW